MYHTNHTSPPPLAAQLAVCTACGWHTVSLEPHAARLDFDRHVREVHPDLPAQAGIGWFTDRPDEIDLCCGERGRAAPDRTGQTTAAAALLGRIAWWDAQPHRPAENLYGPYWTDRPLAHGRRLREAVLETEDLSHHLYRLLLNGGDRIFFLTAPSAREEQAGASGPLLIADDPEECRLCFSLAEALAVYRQVSGNGRPWRLGARRGLDAIDTVLAGWPDACPDEPVPVFPVPRVPRAEAVGFARSLHRLRQRRDLPSWLPEPPVADPPFALEPTPEEARTETARLYATL